MLMIFELHSRMKILRNLHNLFCNSSLDTDCEIHFCVKPALVQMESKGLTDLFCNDILSAGGR